MNATEDFRDAMSQAGLEFSGEIIADGRLRRFKGKGDHARNSWYVLHAGQPIAGAFGCWKRGIKETWRERTLKRFTDAEWRTIRERWEQADKERERTEAERRVKAKESAAWILSRSKPAAAHPYLKSKGVPIHGDVREYRGAIVLPLHDAYGELHSLQLIGTDGTKHFLSGGLVAGCFFTLAGAPDGPLVVCEGYATGASIHEATRFAVICVMNCGNLPAVAQALRAKWPERQFIVAADNDQFTDGNPGLTKATEAAKAIQARLAVPQFADVTSKPTDFNDLHRLQELGAVKTQIEAAELPRLSDDEEIARLAALPLLAYERERETAAERLGCRAGILDKLVDARRPMRDASGSDSLQGTAIVLPDVELWPEPVDGRAILSNVADTFGRFVVLPEGAADALALWAAHTHCFEAYTCTPRLHVTSPDKRCGKSTLRDVLALFVRRPFLAENVTTAVLFRLVHAHTPTLLADEVDGWLRDNEELRSALNSGYRRGGTIPRCVGDSHDLRGFRVFAPVALCGIGALPGTLHDRSIIIRLERAKPGEVRERFDSRRTEHERELCRKLARWCADHQAELEACEPKLPASAFNRLADNWRPLFAMAEVAGGDWPQRATIAFAKLTCQEDSEAQGVGAMLLEDIRQVFKDSRAERLFSKRLVEALCAMTDRPWPEAHRGNPISETWLARRLHQFGIVPRTLRIGDERAKGYEMAALADAFARYLPNEGEAKRDTVTTPDFAGAKSSFGSVTQGKPVTDAKTQETLESIGLSRCHGSEALAQPAKPKLVEEVV